MDAIEQRIRRLSFPYDGDNAARLEIERRLAVRARAADLIVYSELVSGVIFQLPNVNGGKPFQLGVPEWTDLHRNIIGNYLGRISCDSWLRAGFLASAVAVSSQTREPGEGFRALVRELGLLPTGKDSEHLPFWIDQLNKAYAWYSAHPEYPG